MIKVPSVIFTLFFLASVLALPALGHGLGQTLTKDVNGFTIELEYESLELTDDEPIEYGLRLIEKDTGSIADFDLVALRILDKKEDRGVFSTSISAKDSAGLGPRVYLKLEEGEYTFRLTFFRGEEELAAEAFDLSVLTGERQGSSPTPIVLGFLAGAVVAGAGVGFLLKRAK